MGGWVGGGLYWWDWGSVVEAGGWTPSHISLLWAEREYCFAGRDNTMTLNTNI